MSSRIRLARTHDVREGRSFTTEVNGTKIVLFKKDGAIHACENACPHMGAPLDDGVVIAGELTCRWHMWSFDLKTGECTTNSLAPKNLRVFPVTIEGGEVWIEL
jgi:nitrite reductase/ring-hydroxylating ferredoxin subunit